MLVIVDTTEFKKDRFLEDNAFRLLLRGSERGDFRVAIGEVTIREAVNHVRENGEKALGELDRALKALRNLRQPFAPKILTDLTARTIADSYDVFLRGELTRPVERIGEDVHTCRSTTRTTRKQVRLRDDRKRGEGLVRRRRWRIIPTSP